MIIIIIIFIVFYASIAQFCSLEDPLFIKGKTKVFDGPNWYNTHSYNINVMARGIYRIDPASHIRKLTASARSYVPPISYNTNKGK